MESARASSYLRGLFTGQKLSLTVHKAPFTGRQDASFHRVLNNVAMSLPARAGNNLPIVLSDGGPHFLNCR